MNAYVIAWKFNSLSFLFFFFLMLFFSAVINISIINWLLMGKTSAFYNQKINQLNRPMTSIQPFMTFIDILFDMIVHYSLWKLISIHDFPFLFIFIFFSPFFICSFFFYLFNNIDSSFFCYTFHIRIFLKEFALPTLFV